MEQYYYVLKVKGNPQRNSIFKDSYDNDVIIYTVDDFELKSLRTNKIDEYLKNYNCYVQSVGVQEESTFQQKIFSYTKKIKELCIVEYIPQKGKRAGQVVKDYFLGERKLLFAKDYSILEKNRLFREGDINDFLVES